MARLSAMLLLLLRIFPQTLGASIPLPLARGLTNGMAGLPTSLLLDETAFGTNTRRDSQEWPTNIIFYAGPELIAGFVPNDGQTYDLGNILCLAATANALAAVTTLLFLKLELWQDMGHAN
ncbi:uncharacterized protein PV07_10506 [Cladophialophora immunda]|uniref:Uncharacterized protein n=1 Tax=Cladophialophora immunda TaxID=569365 RepID=A0A0D1ZAS9_9EURO|nr:uncharacterized protein PV07_10506 [Cladophialophora immunda]KIW24816.1 hypothetical protein PV07_10506 [Cladophialophora immunda]